MTIDFDVLDNTEKLIFALRSLYMQSGFRRYRMNKVEEYDLYGRNKDFLVSDGIITFTDTSGRLMALKPDVTLSIIKNGRDRPGEPDRLCYNENVYRVSKSTGAFKEIMQAGLECIGEVNIGHVGEVLRLAAESLDLLGADHLLEVSHLGILDAFLSRISTGEDIRASVLKCVGEKNRHGIAELCSAHGVAEERYMPLIRLLDICGEVPDVLRRLDGISEEYSIGPETEELREALSVLGGEAKNVRVDFSNVGDMNYYNGIIFSGFVEGVPGSVLSGGQYDRLMRRMGRSSKAVGFAVYLDMLERVPVREDM